MNRACFKRMIDTKHCNIFYKKENKAIEHRIVRARFKEILKEQLNETFA